MTTYNDLIADLTRENLLDGTIINFQGGETDFPFARFSSSLKISANSNPNFLNLADKCEVKLPDFSIFQAETRFENAQSTEFFEPANSSPSFPITQNLIKNPTQKRKLKKTKKSGKYCAQCNVRVSTFRLRCKFCDSWVGGNFLFYFLLFGAAIAFVILVLLIVAYKS